MSRCSDLFERVVCDEAHRLRSPKTKTSLSVSRTKVPHLVLLTATPMINKPADLYGLLSQIWHDDWAKFAEEAAKEESAESEEDPATDASAKEERGEEEGAEDGLAQQPERDPALKAR